MQTTKQTFSEKETYTYEDLLELVRILRAPDGCPWDRAQTHGSIRKNLIEETYEVAEGIDRDDSGILREELGDYLFEAAFHTVIEEERGRILPAEIIDGVVRKMISRHPHVFGRDEKNAGEVPLLWEEQKKKEKGYRSVAEEMDALPTALPALMYAQKLLSRAARAGFTYATPEESAEKLREEWRELAAAKGENAQKEEYGDLLLACVNYGRLLGLDAEEALSFSTRKFKHRFREMEAYFTRNGQEVTKCTKNEMVEAWKLAKNGAIFTKNN